MSLLPVRPEAIKTPKVSRSKVLLKAQFYIKTDAGQYLELVDSTSDIPCPLLRHFYDAKGEKDAKFSCRK